MSQLSVNALEFLDKAIQGVHPRVMTADASIASLKFQGVKILLNSVRHNAMAMEYRFTVRCSVIA